MQPVVPPPPLKGGIQKNIKKLFFKYSYQAYFKMFILDIVKTYARVSQIILQPKVNSQNLNR